MVDPGGGASRSTDPAAGTSAATDVSLREYLSSQIENSRMECKQNVDSLRQQVLAAEAANAEAIKTALAAIDKRFDGVNEFRSALADLSKQMATQTALAALGEKMVAANDALEARFEALYQRNRDDITATTKRLDLTQGEAAGSRITKAALYTAVGVAVAFIGLLVVIANYISSH